MSFGVTYGSSDAAKRAVEKAEAATAAGKPDEATKLLSAPAAAAPAATEPLLAAP